MDNELKQVIAELRARVESVYVSVERTRKYFLWTLIITVAVLVLPLIGLVFAIPSFLSVYDSVSNFSY